MRSASPVLGLRERLSRLFGPPDGTRQQSRDPGRFRATTLPDMPERLIRSVNAPPDAIERLRLEWVQAEASASGLRGTSRAQQSAEAARVCMEAYLEAKYGRTSIVAASASRAGAA